MNTKSFEIVVKWSPIFIVLFHVDLLKYIDSVSSFGRVGKVRAKKWYHGSQTLMITFADNDILDVPQMSIICKLDKQMNKYNFKETHGETKLVLTHEYVDIYTWD